MPVLTLDRSNSAQTAAITLVTMAALALLVLVAAHWTWEWLAPRPEARAQPVAVAAGAAPSANGLFGHAERAQSSPSPTGTALRLLGIVAATGGRQGYAVVRIEPRQILTVREGDEIAPGLRLAEVGTDHIVLERDGAAETLAWPIRNTVADAAAPRLAK